MHETISVQNGPLEVCYTDNDSTATCPKCETIIFTDNVSFMFLKAVVIVWFPISLILIPRYIPVAHVTFLIPCCDMND